MSYTTPTITASGTTLAKLKAGGFEAEVENLIAANSFSAYQISLIRLPANKQAQRFFDKLSQNMSKYLGGENVSHAIVAAEFLDFATVLKTWLAAVEEAAVLEAAATRTVTTTINAAGTQTITTVGLS